MPGAMENRRTMMAFRIDNSERNTLVIDGLKVKFPADILNTF
jgi:hypothetical protein